MGHIRGWGLLLAICLPLLVLFSWSRLGAETSRINLQRYTEWSAMSLQADVMQPLQQYYVKNRRPARPGDVQLPPVPKQGGVKAWAIQPDSVLRIELDAKDDGQRVVLRYVPIVRSAAGVIYDCVSNVPPLHASRFCRTEIMRSEADVPAQLAANVEALKNLPDMVSPAGEPIAAGATGRVIAVADSVASVEACGYQCVKPQSCVTPRPLACTRLVREGNSSHYETAATNESFRGSSFATLAEADQACERALGPGMKVLRAGSMGSEYKKLSSGSEYWVHDELRPAGNCWSAGPP